MFPAMQKNKQPYGHRFLDIFNIGDLVSWKNLGKEGKSFGFIINIYVDGPPIISTERTYAFALVQKFDGKTENFMLSNLTLEATNKKEVIK